MHAAEKHSRWSARRELEEAKRAGQPSIAINVVQTFPVGSKIRTEALRVWLSVESTCGGFRRLYTFTEVGSTLEREVVKKWVSHARKKHELQQVLVAVRDLGDVELEQTILQKLRRKYHFVEFRESVKTFCVSLLRRIIRSAPA